MDALTQDDRELAQLILRTTRKVPVNTSVGKLLARSVTQFDLRLFEPILEQAGSCPGETADAIGKLAMQVLTCPEAHRNNPQGLSEAVLEALTPEDRSAIAAAIAEASQFGDLPAGATAQELGALLRQRFEDLKASSVTPPTEAVTPPQSDLEAMQTVLQQARETQEVLRAAAEHGAEMRSLAANGMDHGSLVGSQDGARGGADTIRLGQYIRNLLKGRSAREDQRKLARAISDGVEALKAARVPPRLAHMTERAAEATEKSVEELTAIREGVSDLERAFVQEAVPRWYEKMNADLVSEERALKHAGTNLKWTKWACMASVVASLGTTACQLWVAHGYKTDNDAQQRTTEGLLREQLVATRALSEQLRALTQPAQVKLVPSQPATAPNAGAVKVDAPLGSSATR